MDKNTSDILAAIDFIKERMATKEDLAELRDGLRAEFKGDIAALRRELSGDIHSLCTEMALTR